MALVHEIIIVNDRKHPRINVVWQDADLEGSMNADVCDCRVPFVSKAQQRFSRVRCTLHHHISKHEAALRRYLLATPRIIDP